MLCGFLRVQGCWGNIGCPPLDSSVVGMVEVEMISGDDETGILCGLMTDEVFPLFFTMCDMVVRQA